MMNCIATSARRTIYTAARLGIAGHTRHAVPALSVCASLPTHRRALSSGYGGSITVSDFYASLVIVYDADITLFHHRHHRTLMIHIS